MSTTHSKYTIERFISVLMCILILFICFVIYYELKMAGFPDGHLTGYNLASRLPLTICNWLNVGFLIYFIYFNFRVCNFSRPKLTLMASITLYSLFVIFTLVGIPYYFQVVLGIENGQGG
jgi:hypothetical protein